MRRAGQHSSENLFDDNLSSGFKRMRLGEHAQNDDECKQKIQTYEQNIQFLQRAIMSWQEKLDQAYRDCGRSQGDEERTSRQRKTSNMFL
jgi:hypothetical protein